MLVISMSDFNNNARLYNEPVQIEENGVTIGSFIPAQSGFFSRLRGLFSKKDDTIDGVHRPSRQLKAALRESKRMEKHPEKYKSYNDLGELFEELGI